MSPEKIAKLRELADRGVGGEKENAKAILTRLGIDWRKPKESFKEKVYSTFGKTYQNPIKTYRIKMSLASDVVLLTSLLYRITGSGEITVKEYGYMEFTCTEKQMQDLSRIYHKIRHSFNKELFSKAGTFLNNII